MRLVATLMLALEVFFLKLKLFILTGIAGGLVALKLQNKPLLLIKVLGSGDFNHSGSGEKSQSESDEKNQSPRPVN